LAQSSHLRNSALFRKDVNNSSNKNTPPSIEIFSNDVGQNLTKISTAGPWISFIALFILLSLSIWGQYQSSESGKWVLHTIQVQSQLSRLLSDLQMAETGQRGYLLTGNDEYLEPYNNANSKVIITSTNLKNLTKDNPNQQKNIDRIEKLIGQKFDELKQTISLNKAQNYDEAIKIVKSNMGKNTMDRIRIIIADMEALETDLLEKREKQFTLLRNLVWIAELLTFIAFITIAFLIIKQINNSFTLKQRAEISLREVNQNLQRSNRELEEFAYVASHDLKAPLRGIDNLASWVEEDLKEVMQGEAKENMGLLRGRIKRLESLLDDLLAYSRAGQMKDNYETVNSKLLVIDVALLFNSPNLDLKIKADDTLPTFTTQKTPLEQVFRNLINNAIKHHDRKSISIEITAKQNGEFISFSVKDDGPGIAPEYHERIFEMFKTLKPRDEVEGSGMGLAIQNWKTRH